MSEYANILGYGSIDEYIAAADRQLNTVEANVSALVVEVEAKSTPEEHLQDETTIGHKVIQSICTAIAEGFSDKDIAEEDLAETISDSIQAPPASLKIDWTPDYGIVGFGVSRIIGTTPVEVAETVASNLSRQPETIFSRAENMGPYINVRVDDAILAKQIDSLLASGTDFGRQTATNEVTIVDYSSPNISKPFGINHLRSTVIGEAIARLIDADGGIVIRNNHLGDWGTQFGNLLAAHSIFMPEIPFEELDSDQLNQLYVRFSAEKQEKPELVLKGRQMFKRLCMRDPELTAKWLSAVKASREDFEEVYQILGINFDLSIGESYYEEGAKNIIDLLSSKGLPGVVIEKDDVAYIEGEHPVILRTQDGYVVYAARDLAAIKLRNKRFAPQNIVYVVGEEQTTSFAAVFNVAKAAGITKTDDGREINLEHAGFGLLLDGTGKKLSTRKGTSGKLRDLIGEVEVRCADEIRTRNPEMYPDLVNDNARKLAIAAIVWNDLKTDRKKSVKFDLPKMLEMGSGGVVDTLYSFVRSKRIIEQMGPETESEVAQEGLQLTNQIEHEISLKLCSFPEVVSAAAKERAPHLLITYLEELTRLHGTFYTESRVLGGDIPEGVTRSRAKIHKAYLITLSNAFKLLNIQPPTKL